ncbi:MAG: Fe-S cluster assembly protein IscX [Nitrospirae bacterium]|nr:Fe-S cluster assembly protein IscX [Nitrospirota bacterium]
MDLDWQDGEEIALRLFDRFPDLDPLTVRFTQLHQWVTELTEFKGDPKASNEKKLEAIQMAWYEEYKSGND